MDQQTDNIRISDTRELISPEALSGEIPASAQAVRLVQDTRTAIRDILTGRDDRLLVVVGPCSVHDVDAALAYAEKLAGAREELARDLLIVMRVYFEKPRTTIGWKGLINDPDLDHSFNINKGIRLARRLLTQLAEQGMPTGVEFLDLISPQYLAELVSWGAIGARTTESQGHRELASGLSCPVGFKNGTSGTIKVAVDAVGAARHPHSFLGVTKQGRSAILSTTGNEDGHIILRGGSHGPNYDADGVASALAHLARTGLPERVMIDFSHANSRKQHKKQIEVGDNVAGQIMAGNQAIFGAMIESHLFEGNQKLTPGITPEYGISITDACLGWEDTKTLLGKLAAAVAERRSLAMEHSEC